MIPFIDLATQQERIRPQIDLAIARVLDHGRYAMGPEVYELEEKLAHYCGVKHAITCANGTDALTLALMALKVKPGDAILVPSFTFAATAQVVAGLGAIPIFVDVLADTFNMDPQSLQAALHLTHQKGLKSVGLIPVDLFGQPADYPAIQAIADQYNLWILSDGAQSFGGRYHDKLVGSWGQLTTTSFYPPKPLGCYGEGGAIFTDDDSLAEIIKSLRIHGQGTHQYDNVRVGMNGRLETLQAAILLEKLKIFDEELVRRQHVADRYTAALREIVATPFVLLQATSSWAQYTVRLPSTLDRARIIESLREAGIPTMVYYPKGLHQQLAYAHYPSVPMPVTETLSACVLSLPMHPYLMMGVQDHIIETFQKALQMQGYRLAS